MIRSGRRHLGWFLLAVPVLFLLVALIVFGQVKAFLKSDRFRTFLGDKVAEGIHARGGFQTLDWNGTSFYSENFAAKGDPGADLESLDAQQLRGSVDLGGLWERKWLIRDVELERLVIVPARRETETRVAKPKTEKAAPTKQSGSFFSSWLPDRVEVERVTIANLQFDGKNLDEPFQLQGTRMVAKPDGGAWMLEASGGNLTLAKVPKLTLGEASLRYAESSVFINRATWLVDGGGTLNVNGEVPQTRKKATKLTVKVDRLPAATVLPKDWRARLLGLVSADLEIEAQGDDWKISGPVSLAEGRLEALPVLDQVALFTRTQRFRQLNLDRVTADLAMDKDRITVTHLNAESPGLLRIRGGFVVENKRMNGEFLVGVTPASLRFIPGSQTEIFKTERDGYLWTTMKVTGPLNRLSEDLSERLALAAGQELIDTIQKDPSKLKDTIKDAAQSLLDLLGQ